MKESATLRRITITQKSEANTPKATRFQHQQCCQGKHLKLVASLILLAMTHNFGLEILFKTKRQKSMSRI